MLAQEYRETFTGLTSTTLALSYPPIRTVNDVGLEMIFKNGTLLGASGASASTVVRETFTGIVAAFFTLTSTPVVGSELVFRNGELIDNRAAKNVTVTVGIFQPTVERFTGSSTVAITLSQAPIANSTVVAKNGAVLDPSGGYTVSGSTLTLASRAVGDIIVASYAYIVNASTVVTVDAAPGTYAISAVTKKITPSVAPVASDVFVVLYEAGGAAGGGSADYSIDGATVTFTSALVASDVVEVFYPYRT